MKEYTEIEFIHKNDRENEKIIYKMGLHPEPGYYDRNHGPNHGIFFDWYNRDGKYKRDAYTWERIVEEFAKGLFIPYHSNDIRNVNKLILSSKYNPVREETPKRKDITRKELELNLKWCHNNPDRANEVIAKFTKECEENDMIVEYDFSRQYYLTVVGYI